MKIADLTEKLEETYHKHFPNSSISARFELGMYPSIWVACYLAGDKKENSGGYWENDMLRISFRILNGEDMDFSRSTSAESLVNSVTIEAHRKTYTTKPSDKFSVYGHAKLSFRKTVGTPENIIKVFDAFCTKLKASIKNDLENDKIHADHVELIKIKLS